MKKLCSRAALICAAFATAYVSTICAQKFELAKISLGMSEQDVRSALGPGYQFFHQPVNGIPGLSFVFAANPGQTASYSFALIDGKVQAFMFYKRFEKGQYPLVQNLRNSVAAKLWQPNLPNESIWYSDTAGHAITSGDNMRMFHCNVAASFEDTQLLRNASNIPQVMVDLLKGLQQPRIIAANPGCGLSIQQGSTRDYLNTTLATATTLTVKNIAAFSSLAKQEQQRRQAQNDSQTRQANQVKTPY